MASEPQCAKRGCKRRAVVAYDVWSWLKPLRQQTPRHYEVCEEHESYFTGCFDSDASERVRVELEGDDGE